MTWTGRALAFGGTVTANHDTITVPTCAAPATLHVVKLVVNGSGGTGPGTSVPANFTLHVKNASGTELGGGPFPGASVPGTRYTLNAGTYTISEDTNSSYVQTFDGFCPSGSVTLSAGQDLTCTVINTDIPAPVAPSPAPASGGGGGVIIPLIGILKVPTPLALPTGPGSVTYNYTVWNVGGQQALTNVTVTDDKCSPVTFLSGDTNGDGKLDPHESWMYSCTTSLSSTTTNTAIATGHTGSQTAIATAIATVAVGVPVPPPLINIVKVPSRLTPFPFGGGNVVYTYAVTNPGVVPMHNVTVTDDKCGTVSGPLAGDTNGNGLLDPGETWGYSCQTNISVSTRNTATAEGKANGFTAIGYAFATVLVSAPGLPNTGLPPESNNAPWGIVVVAGLLAGSLIFYAIRKKQTA